MNLRPSGVAYRYLDLTPKGRNENGPYYNMHDWVRLHDSYGDAVAESAGVAASPGPQREKLLARPVHLEMGAWHAGFLDSPESW
jgi:hypothetical protein